MNTNGEIGKQVIISSYKQNMTHVSVSKIWVNIPVFCVHVNIANDKQQDPKANILVIRLWSTLSQQSERPCVNITIIIIIYHMAVCSYIRSNYN